MTENWGVDISLKQDKKGMVLSLPCGGSQPCSPLAALGSLHPHIHPQGPLPQDPDTSGAEALNPS